MLKKEDIINILKKYDLPKNEFVVISGAAMVLQGIKEETNDIDITVSDSLYDYLIKKSDCSLEKITSNGKSVWYLNELNFSNNYYSTVEYLNLGEFQVQTPDNIKKLKTELNREKDSKDIDLINKFLENKTSDDVMSINFLGNGSGFSKTHTGAFFFNDKDLILIDCSMLNIHKILDLGINNFEKIYLLITHMHDDHVSGLGLFIQYMFYVYKNKLNLMIPGELIEDMKDELRIKGISNEIYNLYNLDEIEKPSWFINKIKTKHAPELDGKCFGYKLLINSKKICYSGDTNILDVYEKHLTDCDEFYVDVSAEYGGVHLKYKEVEDKLLHYIEKFNLKIFIMHIDNESSLKKMINDKIKIAKIYH